MAKKKEEIHHSACVKAFEALRRDGTDVLSHHDHAALGGQKIAKCDLSKKRLAKADQNLRSSNGNGKYAGHSNENRHLVEAQKYKDHAEQGGIGLAGYHKENELKMKERIEEACDKFDFVDFHRDKKGDKIGFDMKPVKDVE